MRFYYNKQASFWDDFITSAGPRQTEFLQSFTWSEIMKRKGIESTWLYGEDENNNWLMTSVLYKEKLSFLGYYWYCPRGPFISQKICQRYDILELEAWRRVFSSWFKEAKRNKIVFIRFEPGLRLEEENEKEKDNVKNLIKKVAKSLGYKLKETKAVQPKKSLLLDLSLGEENIKKQMKAKTRYNINLAKRKDLKVSYSLDYFNDFYNLLKKTSQRDVFRLHPKNHYENIIKAGGKNIMLISILDNERLIAAGLFSLFGKKMVYLHGASDYKERQKMAPYLLQWTAISKAINLGFRYYDFHGIDDKKWPGVSRFKKGFGGFEINYPGTFDLLVYPRKYYLFSFLKTLKRKLKFK